MNTKRTSKSSVGATAHVRVLSRPPVRKVEPPPPSASELTKPELEELRAELERRYQQLSESIEQRRIEERSIGASREVGDEMDEAASEGTASLTSKLLERDLGLRSSIERALAKFEDGTYGLCEGTGEPIGVARLRLQPWARYSVAFQEDLESRSRARGGV